MMIGFIETLTLFGSNALAPIDRIKYVNLIYTGETVNILIVSDDGNWEEHYKEENEAIERYDEIKEILGAE